MSCVSFKWKINECPNMDSVVSNLGRTTYLNFQKLKLHQKIDQSFFVFCKQVNFSNESRILSFSNKVDIKYMLI